MESTLKITVRLASWLVFLTCMAFTFNDDLRAKIIDPLNEQLFLWRAWDLSPEDQITLLKRTQARLDRISRESKNNQ